MSNYKKGFLKAYVDLCGNTSCTVYYIKVGKNNLYNKCKEYLDLIRTTQENNKIKIESIYLECDKDRDYYLGYCNAIFHKFKFSIRYYRSNRLNKEFYYSYDTTKKELITNITKALKYLGIQYRMYFFPMELPRSHRYRIRINKKASIERLIKEGIISSNIKEKINY